MEYIMNEANWTFPYDLYISPDEQIRIVTIFDNIYIAIYQKFELLSIYSFTLEKIWGSNNGINILQNHKDLFVNYWSYMIECLRMEFDDLEKYINISKEDFIKILEDKYE